MRRAEGEIARGVDQARQEQPIESADECVAARERQAVAVDRVENGSKLNVPKYARLTRFVDPHAAIEQREAGHGHHETSTCYHHPRDIAFVRTTAQPVLHQQDSAAAGSFRGAASELQVSAGASAPGYIRQMSASAHERHNSTGREHTIIAKGRSRSLLLRKEMFLSARVAWVDYASTRFRRTNAKGVLGSDTNSFRRGFCRCGPRS